MVDNEGLQPQDYSNNSWITKWNSTTSMGFERSSVGVRRRMGTTNALNRTTCIITEESGAIVIHFRLMDSRYVEMENTIDDFEHLTEIKGVMVTMQQCQAVEKCECERTCGKHCKLRNQRIECNPLHHGGSNCKNQRSQRLIEPKLRIKRYREKGLGLVTEENLSNRQLLGRVTGHVRKGVHGVKRHGHMYATIIDSSHIVDSARGGNIMRFLNFSCSPNVLTEKWNVNGKWEILVFTSRDINTGEELTIPFEERGFKGECKCGNGNCSSIESEMQVIHTLSKHK